MINIKKDTKKLTELINNLRTHLKTIKDFVPVADIKQIYIVDTVIQLLESKNDSEIYGTIVHSNDYFQNAIGYVQAYEPEIDEQKLEKLVNAVVSAAKEQNQQSPQQILKEMRDYKNLVQAQEHQKREFLEKIWRLLLLEYNTLNIATAKARITAKHTKDRFKSASNLILEMTNKPLDKLGNIDVDFLRSVTLRDLTEHEKADLLIQKMTERE